MILSNSQAHREIQRLQRVLGYALRELEVAVAQRDAYEATIHKMKQQDEIDARLIQCLYRECFF